MNDFDQALQVALEHVPDPNMRAALIAIAAQQKRMHEENQGSRWRLRKEFTIGDVVGIIGLVAAVITIWTSLNTRFAQVETRLTVLEESRQMRIASQNDRDKKQDEEAIRYQARVDKSLDDINGKLDRLIERQAHGGKGG